MQSLVTKVNRLLYLLLIVTMISGCDYITKRNFRVINKNDGLTVNHLSNLIEEYFLSIGFKAIQIIETSFPDIETSKKYYVGEAYKELKFSKPSEYISIRVINNREVLLQWDQFGPNFQPKPEYFHSFKYKIQEYIKNKTGYLVTIYELPKE